MLRPPRELDREAFVQAQSGRGPPASSDRASRMVRSKTLIAPLMWLGEERRAKATLGKARHERRRVGWSPSGSLGDLGDEPKLSAPSSPCQGQRTHSKRVG